MVLRPEPRGDRPRPTARTWGFRNAAGGNVAILFGVLSLPMLMFTGAAIDYGMATRLETNLQSATDATVILLCQASPDTSVTTLNDLAKKTMIGQMGTTGLIVDQLVIATNPRQITLTTHITQTALFGKFTNVASLTPAAVARCATPTPQLEIAMVLDNTGSMQDAGDDGVTKLSALQSAAKDFIAYVFTPGTFADGTRMSIVPFAASVAVNAQTYRNASWVDTKGQSKYHWNNVVGAAASGFTSRFDIFSKLQGVASSWAWAGCFEALPHPQNVTDTGITTGDYNTLYIPYFAPDEAGEGALQPKSFDGKTYTSYNSYIDDYTSDKSCPYQTPAANIQSYMAAQGRACKYTLPKDPKTGRVSGNGGKYFGVNGPNFGCTSQALQTLTSSTSALNAVVTKMSAGGVTNIHEGVMWGWRTISPNSVLSDGTIYPYVNSRGVIKVIILMTDGENTWYDLQSVSNISGNSYNTPSGSLFSADGYYKNTDYTGPDIHFPANYAGVSDAGSARNALDALTRLACQNAGKAGVRIFTVGLSVSSDPIDAQGVQLLKDCAVKYGRGQYFQANDADSLIDAFKKIAGSLGSLRITQ